MLIYEAISLTDIYKAISLLHIYFKLTYFRTSHLSDKYFCCLIYEAISVTYFVAIYEAIFPSHIFVAVFTCMKQSLSHTFMKPYFMS